MSVNKVTLLGNVGKDPDIRTTKDGRKIASFTVATSERWKDKQSGEMKEQTEWHRVVVLNENLANIVEKCVKKGSRLYIEGALKTRKWTDKDGVERYVTEIVLQGYNGKLDMQPNSNGAKNNPKDEEGAYGGGEEHYSADVNIDDEVPF